VVQSFCYRKYTPMTTRCRCRGSSPGPSSLSALAAAGPLTAQSAAAATTAQGNKFSKEPADRVPGQARGCCITRQLLFCPPNKYVELRWRNVQKHAHNNACVTAFPLLVTPGSMPIARYAPGSMPLRSSSPPLGCVQQPDAAAQRHTAVKHSAPAGDQLLPTAGTPCCCCWHLLRPALTALRAGSALDHTPRCLLCCR
jgi:hypothetical protein